LVLWSGSGERLCWFCGAVMLVLWSGYVGSVERLCWFCGAVMWGGSVEFCGGAVLWSYVGGSECVCVSRVRVGMVGNVNEIKMHGSLTFPGRRSVPRRRR
jgi:hypothetical protein